MEGCQVSANHQAGVFIREGAAPTLLGNTILDHRKGGQPGGSGCGVWVASHPNPFLKIGPGNVFSGNQVQDVASEGVGGGCAAAP